MDPSSHITIPASGVSRPDPDADSSSTKTEVEEMELDQLSDVEDNVSHYSWLPDLAVIIIVTEQIKGEHFL